MCSGREEFELDLAKAEMSWAGSSGAALAAQLVGARAIVGQVPGTWCGGLAGWLKCLSSVSNRFIQVEE